MFVVMCACAGVVGGGTEGNAGGDKTVICGPRLWQWLAGVSALTGRSEPFIFPLPLSNL